MEYVMIYPIPTIETIWDSFVFPSVMKSTTVHFLLLLNGSKMKSDWNQNPLLRPILYVSFLRPLTNWTELLFQQLNLSSSTKTRWKMLLLSQTRERLRGFLSFTTIASWHHATLREAEKITTFSTVQKRRHDKRSLFFSIAQFPSVESFKLYWIAQFPPIESLEIFNF